MAIFSFAYFQDGHQSLGLNLQNISGPTCSNLMILELISIKPNAISKLYKILKLFGSQGQRSRAFYGSYKVKKDIKFGA